MFIWLTAAAALLVLLWLVAYRKMISNFGLKRQPTAAVVPTHEEAVEAAVAIAKRHLARRRRQ